jgi:hypothetical protein
MIGKLGVDSGRSKNVSLLPDSCPMTVVYFSRGKRAKVSYPIAEAKNAMEVYLHSPIHLHTVIFN